MGFDGCDMRERYLRMLLSATILDGSNGLFPIAFVIVEFECEDT